MSEWIAFILGLILMGSMTGPFVLWLATWGVGKGERMIFVGASLLLGLGWYYLFSTAPFAVVIK